MARVSTLVKQVSKSKPWLRSKRAGSTSLRDALLGKIDVPPAGEAVLKVPLRLAVPQENERRHQAVGLLGGLTTLGLGRLELGQDRVECVQAGVGEILRALRRPAVNLVGQIEIVLERHFQGHRDAAIALGELGRRHRHIGLARSRDLIALLALEIGRQPLERLAEQVEQPRLAFGDRRDAFEAGEKIGGNGLVAMHVHREIDPGFVHGVADAQDFRAPFGRGRVPFAIEVRADRIGAQMAAARAVRIHVGDDAERAFAAQQARHRILFVGQFLERAFHPPFGHALAGMLAGIKPHA